MIKLNLNIQGLTGLQQGLKNAPSVLDRNLSIAVDQSVQAIHRNLAVNWKAGGYGVPIDSGDLRRSLFQRFLSVGGILRGEIGTNLDYGIYVYEGKGGNRYVGPRPYLEKSSEKAMPIILKHFDDAISKTLKSI